MPPIEAEEEGGGPALVNKSSLHDEARWGGEWWCAIENLHIDLVLTSMDIVDTNSDNMKEMNWCGSAWGQQREPVWVTLKLLIRQRA